MVRFLIVGAYAVSFHAEPRATGDLDVWVEPTPQNAERVLAALRVFGAPLHDLTAGDLASPDVVFQIGLPPRRIDILTSITGVAFDQAWDDRTEVSYDDVRCPVIGRDALITNKLALARPKVGAGSVRCLGVPLSNARTTNSEPLTTDNGQWTTDNGQRTKNHAYHNHRRAGVRLRRTA